MVDFLRTLDILARLYYDGKQLQFYTFQGFGLNESNFDKFPILSRKTFRNSQPVLLRLNLIKRVKHRGNKRDHFFVITERGIQLLKLLDKNMIIRR